MWQRIISASTLIIGTVILLLIFTVTLYVLEKKCTKKQASGRLKRTFTVVAKTDKTV